MKILAVDDDELALELLRDCLSDGGYPYSTLMSSPGDVLRALAATAMPYECILLDVGMPGISGTQLCAQIRALPRHRHTPIIMITKHADHGAVQDAFANGATDYITKPYDCFEVITRIRLAERLVQERQAALDSYAALQQGALAPQDAVTRRAPRRLSAAVPVIDSDITGERLLPIGVFQNYLEQMARSGDGPISLFAARVCQLDEIFASAAPAEFSSFLTAVAGALAHRFDAGTVFMTHAGAGTYLCADLGSESFDIAAAEADTLSHLRPADLPPGFRGEAAPRIVIGAPLALPSSAKLNFKRAMKAALARMEQRDADADKMLQVA